MSYKIRIIEAKIRKTMKYYPVVAVLGARQAGKSTMIEHMFGETINTVVFDPVQDIGGARNDPDFFLQNLETPAFLDEIQYAPELLASIKRKVDKEKKRGAYIISGSQNLAVLKDVSESLAGRAAIINLMPLSKGEISGIKSKTSFLSDWLKSNEPIDIPKNPSNLSIYHRLWRGGFPGILDFPDDMVHGYFQSYMQTYIERDIRKVANIGNLQTFGRFVGLISSLTSRVINYNELGRELGLDRKTVKHWTEILEATFQWFSIPPFSRNPIKRIVGKPKGYFSDTGFSCYLQRITSPDALRTNPITGRLFESYLFQEIIKTASGWPTPPNIYHFRSFSGAETDLILEIDGKLHPIEIKMTSRPRPKDLAGFNSFKKCFVNESVGKSLVISAIEQPCWLTKDIYAVPWWAL